MPPTKREGEIRLPLLIIRGDRHSCTSKPSPRIEISFKDSGARAPAADIDAVICARLEPLLAIATRRGLAVALYPHSFYPLERIDHAERIVRRLRSPNLSFVFATSHVYAVSTAAETVAQLRACADRIASFNVCGCTRLAPTPPAKCTHHPLDGGELPLPPLFAVLRQTGYRGSVIVQGYGWQGALPDQLKRCVTAAKTLFPQVSARSD